MMDIDIRGDRTCDLPVTSSLQDELLNRKAFLPLKETLVVNIAIHIYFPVRFFLSLLFDFSIYHFHHFPADLPQRGGGHARIYFFFFTVL